MKIENISDYEGGIKLRTMQIPDCQGILCWNLTVCGNIHLKPELSCKIFTWNLRILLSDCILHNALPEVNMANREFK